MGKKLLLINPPFPGKAKSIPLSASYLAGAAALAIPKENVRILDLNVEKSPRKLRDVLAKFKPTHSGITRFSPNAKEGMGIMREIKKQDSSIITISGGPHEVFCGENTIRRFGPGGEAILDHVVSGFDGVSQLYTILGIDGSSLPQRTVDVVPAHELLMGNSPKYQFGGLFDSPMTQLITSTGCSNSCSFCHHDRYIPASVNVVVESVQKVLSLGFGAVIFDDLNFVNNLRRTANIMKEFAKLRFEWGCQIRADSLSENIVESMVSAGCTYICMGLDPERQKRLTFKAVEESVNLLRKYRIRVGLYTMLGHPDDIGNEKHIFETVERLAPDFLSLSIFAFYPDGSTLSELCEGYENGQYSRDENWLNFDEGWGAKHTVDLDYALRVLELVEGHVAKNPETWNKIKRF